MIGWEILNQAEREFLRERFRNLIDYWMDDESLLLNEGVEVLLDAVEEFLLKRRLRRGKD